MVRDMLDEDQAIGAAYLDMTVRAGGRIVQPRAPTDRAATADYHDHRSQGPLPASAGINARRLVPALAGRVRER